MSPKSAVFISTKEANHEDDDICQYLRCVLSNLGIKIQKSFYFEDSDNLSQKIRGTFENNLIFLITNKHEFVYKILSNIFGEKLIKSNHIGEMSIPCTSQIFQPQNDVNSICVKFKNIYIIPDNINSAKTIFENILKCLLMDKNDELEKHFVVTCNQNGLKTQINDCLKIFSDVNFYNYCVAKNDFDCESHIYISSKNFYSLTKCENIFQKLVSGNIMYRNVEPEFWNRLERINNEYFVEKAITVLERCFTEYELREIFICFNGGKDCTALLYLTYYVINTLYPNYKEPFVCLYIKPNNAFEELDQFVDQCKTFFNFELVMIQNSQKKAVEEFLSKRPNFTTCLMGLRRTDPNSNKLSHFAMTDNGWPSLMRVCPILDWTYNNIWKFLLSCKIPYCELYDHGYTSIGSKINSKKNLALKYIENGEEKYWPAYKLTEEEKERTFRAPSTL